MNKYNLIFPGLGYANHFQADVKIFDECMRLICRGRTYNGRISACLKKNRIYYVCASACSTNINKSIYTTNNTNIYIPFPNSIYQNNRTSNITFLLNDYHYDNLPIEKGRLILWQNK